MGQTVADSDPNSGGRFRLLPDEESVSPSPVPLPQGVGQPPGKPPVAPPLAAVPEPEPERPNTFEIRIKQLEQENDQLVCALFWLQQEIKELRGSK